MDNTDKLLDDLFEKARTTESQTSFEIIQKEFLANTKLGVKANLLTLKNGLIMLATITTIGLSLLYITSPNDNKKEIIETENVTELNFTKNEVELIKTEQDKIVKEHLKKVALLSPNLKSLYNIEMTLANKIKETLPDSLKKAKKVRDIANRNKEMLDTTYRFPNLTKEEIAANEKQKTRMFGKRKNRKKDPFGFLFIPSGSYHRNDIEVSVNTFYMKQTEVSNLEYRTFLFDLLIQNRKEEFLIAKPDQSRWIKDYPYAFNEPMKENYFSHPAYDDYPVVAISRSGAELYCKWFSEELKKVNQRFVGNVRLPNNYEWEYAAKGGMDRSPYPWGGPYLRNSNGCFLANFKPGIKANNIECKSKSKIKSWKIGGEYTADGAFHTAKVNSYNPNDFGLYCLSGNAAEMIYYEDENNLSGTKGGSWTSIGQELQIIDGKDRFKGLIKPSVDVGFRPVITYLDPKKPLVGVLGKATSIPPGTVQITNNLYFDATEITNFSWQEYLSWQANKYGKNAIEYKNSLPDTTVWDKLNKSYTTHYYSHPAYRDYPVVGISYNQAVAYCKWRTDRVKQLYKSSDAKEFIYRLPTKLEWENAAKAGYSSINVKKDGDKPKFNIKRNKDEDIGVAGKLNDNADVIVPSRSYWPNDYGIYNIIGNVAEMVQEKGVAKGGSWKHSAEQASLTKQISYTKPTSWLGFRCVCEIVD